MTAGEWAASATIRVPAPTGLSDDAASLSASGPRAAGQAAAASQKSVGDAGGAWAAALLKVLGFADGVYSTDQIRILWGPSLGGSMLAKLKGYAEEVERDTVFLEFRGPVEDGPTSVAFANFDKRGATVSVDCELWEIPRSASVELLTARHRFRLNQRGNLERKPNGLDKMRARRVAMANQRWRNVAARRMSEDLGGWQLVDPAPSSLPDDEADADGRRKIGSALRNSPFPLKGSGEPVASTDATVADASAYAARLEGLRPYWKAWSMALDDLMRDPSDTEREELLIYGGYATPGERRSRLLAISRERRSSVLYLSFGEPAADGPVDVTAVLYSNHYDKVVDGCAAFAADDGSPVQLLNGSHRVVLDKNGKLSLRRPHRSDAENRLRARAWERWRAAAAARMPASLPDAELPPSTEPRAGD